MVTFEAGHVPGLFAANGFMALLQELETFLGRSIDLVTRSAIEREENDFLRSGILSRTEVLYA